MRVNGERKKREGENAKLIKLHFNIRCPFIASQQRDCRIREEEKTLDKREIFKELHRWSVRRLAVAILSQSFFV